MHEPEKNISYYSWWRAKTFILVFLGSQQFNYESSQQVKAFILAGTVDEIYSEPQ